MLAVGSLGLGMAAFFQYNESIKIAERSAIVELNQSASHIATSMDSLVDSNIKLLKSLADTNAAKSRNESVMRDTIIPLSTYNYYFDHIFATREDGLQYVRSDEEKGKGFMEQPAFKQLLNSGNHVVDIVDIGNPSVLMMAPVKDGTTVSGAVGGLIDLQILSNIFKKSANEVTRFSHDTNIAFIATREGKLIYHPTLSEVKSDKLFSNAKEEIASIANTPEFKALNSTLLDDVFTYTDENGRKMLGTSVTTQNGWVVGVSRPVDEIHEISNSNSMVFSALLVGSLLLLISTASVIVLSFTSTLARLNNAAKRIESGDKDLSDIRDITESESEFTKYAKLLNVFASRK